MQYPPEPLFDVLRAYAALYPPRLLQFPREFKFHQVHNFLVDSILLNRHFQEYPPSAQYQASFWKWAIDRLENYGEEDIELDERLYAHHIALMTEASSGASIGLAPPPESYVTYMWKAGELANGAVYPGYESATLLESRTMIESGTTGYRTWTASLSLAQYLTAYPELVQGKRVLELGSGSGFLGIAISALQSQPDLSDAQFAALWLTDLTEDVLQRCSRNITLPCNTSSRHPNVHCRLLDWSDALDSAKDSAVKEFLHEANPDVIIGADLVYEPSVIPALVGMLRSGIETPTSKNIVAYIALTVRNQDTYNKFLGEAERCLVVEELTIPTPGDGLLTPDAEFGKSETRPEVKILKIRRNTVTLQ
ncbi:hypothetical protein OBBRIDRAFT_871167 [Obba rivulosa]|uniref:Uncharacterized protein n=1 Tax=Obba rivulosa TaxID=1052685 RepID=A0A8E2DU47_9APHY|nr:hypothetical protein OBBRIDRAFT_871167 [Obba rivulosa]